MRRAIAIATSDWHFWHVAPVWRSNEPNWLEAMARQLRQIIKESYRMNVPILNSGDIFDHFNPTPETINFLMNELKNPIYAVPGQHDLEHHILGNIRKTGFCTLLEGGHLIYRNDGYWNHDEKCGFDVYFAPWGTNISQIAVVPRKCKRILLAHKYVWFDDTTRYGGSTIPSGKLSGLKADLQKFDFAIFGDNHIPFRVKIGKCQVINCGTMVRRKLDERDYETGYTILFDDGSVQFCPFDISQDVNIEVKIEEENDSEINISSRKFMEELQAMDENEIDFKTEVERKVGEINRKDMEQKFSQIFSEYEEIKK